MPSHRNRAVREVRTKSDATIERETATKWADRAIACYAVFEETDDAAWRCRGDQYRSEALEHAAQVGDHGKFVGQLQTRIDRARGPLVRSRRIRA